MATKVLLNGQLMFPSDYVSAVEFKGRDVTLTIASVKIEQMAMKGGKKEAKPVLTFKETPKKLAMNKTNAGTIAELYGTEAEKWPGNRITLYPTKTQFGRDTVDCIRVREFKPNGQHMPPPKQMQTQQPDVDQGGESDFDRLPSAEDSLPDQEHDAPEQSAPAPAGEAQTPPKHVPDHARVNDSWINDLIINAKPADMTGAVARKAFHAADVESWAKLSRERQDEKFRQLVEHEFQWSK